MGSSALASGPGQFNKYPNREAACGRGSHLLPGRRSCEGWTLERIVSPGEGPNQQWRDFFPKSSSPPQPDCNPEGNLRGDGQLLPQGTATGGGGLHVSCKGLSPLALGQGLLRETPSSCWAISFQLCPSIAAYSFTKAALAAPSPPLPPTCSSLSIPDPRTFVYSFPGGVLRSADLKFSPGEAGRRAQLAAVPRVGQAKPM